MVQEQDRAAQPRAAAVHVSTQTKKAAGPESLPRFIFEAET
jgi:hypothetical protein